MPLISHLIDADFTYRSLDLAAWSIAEVGIGIIATGLATLRPLVSKMGFIVSTITSDQYQSGGTHTKPYTGHEFNMSTPGHADSSNVIALHEPPHVGVKQGRTMVTQSETWLQL
jgi:hypothetical protein